MAHHRRDRTRNPVLNPLPTDEDSDPEHLNDTVVILGERIIADEDEKREYVPVWEQEVRDENGKRRFHGAFTGGFSAGYFNTVGSKEGWAPTSFQSSREQRAAPNEQRPEDFMDDEDKALFGDGSAARISTTADYRTKDEPSDMPTKPKDGERRLLSMTVAPSHENVGMRMLKVMGWREGQGIGPRRHRIAEKVEKEPEKRVYGATLPPELSARRGESEKPSQPWETAVYAPERVPLFSEITVKNDRFGFGFEPPTLTELVGPSAPARQAVSGGFGVGAFEDDDMDEYDNNDSRGVYSHVVDGNEEDHLTTEQMQAVKSATTAAERRSQFSQVRADDDHKCRDGERLPAGFQFEEGQSVHVTWYPPPVVPERFMPKHKFDANDPTPESLAPHLHMMSVKGRPMLSINERADMLGEAQLPSLKVPPQSVWDLLKPEDRDKLQRIKGEMEKKREEKKPPQAPKSRVPEPAKVSGLLSSRFTASSSTVQQPPSATTGLTQPEEITEVDIGPSHHDTAAQMGMFGQMTRTTQPFTPSRMLCRRFGVSIPQSEPVREHVVSRDDWRKVMPKIEGEASEPIVVEEEEEEIPERPHIDLFKAVFDDSESDDDKGEVSMDNVVVRGALAAAAKTREPSKPTETREPSKPSVRREPSKPSVRREPSKPTETREPSKPTETREPSKPSVRREPSKPTETREPSKPSVRREPTRSESSKHRHEPSNPSVRHEPTRRESPTVRHEPTRREHRRETRWDKPPPPQVNARGRPMIPPRVEPAPSSQDAMQLSEEFSEGTGHLHFKRERSTAADFM